MTRARSSRRWAASTRAGRDAAHRRARGGQPAVPRATGRDRRGGRARGAAAEHRGGARGPPRPARAGRAPRARARVGRGTELSPRRPRRTAGRRCPCSALIALARRQLIRAHRPEHAAEDAFRFAHALIREVAYSGLPKLQRADLHERLAEWLKTKPQAADEIVGYHLERACRYRSELGQAGETTTRSPPRLRSDSQARPAARCGEATRPRPPGYSSARRRCCRATIPSAVSWRPARGRPVRRRPARRR